MELNKIYLGDCLEVAKDIPSGSVDLILTDLPYGNMNGIDKKICWIREKRRGWTFVGLCN